MAHILGQREFWSLAFKVTADTLDPRPDSETLVQAVLDQVPERSAPVRLVDFGTGTGCLLLSLLHELPNAVGLGVDASAAALAIAAENANALGLAQRTTFRRGHWDDGIEPGFDIVLSNPPYIPSGDIPGLQPEVASFEPRLALDGGADGLDAYRRLGPAAMRLLVSDGLAVLEIGIGQGDSVRRMMAAAHPVGLARTTSASASVIVILFHVERHFVVDCDRDGRSSRMFGVLARFAISRSGSLPLLWRWTQSMCGGAVLGLASLCDWPAFPRARPMVSPDCRKGP